MTAPDPQPTPPADHPTASSASLWLDELLRSRTVAPESPAAPVDAAGPGSGPVGGSASVAIHASRRSAAADPGPDSELTSANSETGAAVTTPRAPLPAHVAASLDPGRPPPLGRLEFIRKLGEGGMGQVWLAWDAVLCVERAVKVPQPRFSRDPRWRESMLREARVLAQLSHPGIARLHEFVVEGDRCALVMEYVRGRTLRQILVSEGAMPLDEAQRICRAVAEAVETAHAHPMRIVHCDLKPANVMVADDGAIKVLDWGIAQREQPDGSGTEHAAGTPGYTAPEVAGAHAWPGRSADLFSLGAILFECLAGERTFPGDRATDRVSRTVHAEPPWERLPAATPPAVRSLLRRLLEKSPRLRCPDVAEVVAVLASPARALAPSRTTPTNIPAATTRFVGRDSELSSLRGRLGGARAVVIHGLGGMGKTALALQAARALADDRLVGAFPDGIWLVRLGPLDDDSLLEEAVASAVGGLAGGSQGTLASRLADRALLLILDRCEHVARGASDLCRDLLERCPSVRIVATSREPLAIPGAALMRLGPLETRGDGGRDAAAVELFIDSARRVLGEYEPSGADRAVVADLVDRLDGIPLAVEMAAAWLSRCEVADLVRNLEAAAPLAVVDAGARATSDRDRADRAKSMLEAVVVGSIGQLSAAARTLLGRLTVFRAGWTLEAAERVCGDPDEAAIPERPFGSPDSVASTKIPALLGQLVDRSLVEFERVEGGRRYRMLRPVRAAAESIRGDDPMSIESLGERLLAWCVAFVERDFAARQGRGGQDVEGRRLDVLMHEWPNLRWALEWAIERRDLASASSLALGLHRAWYARGMHREGWIFLERTLAISAPAQATAPRALGASEASGEDDRSAALRVARLHNAAGMLRWQAGDLDAAESHFVAAGEALDSPDDSGPSDTPSALAPHPGLVALLVNRALVAKDRARAAPALKLLEEARTLARRLGLEVGQAQAELNAAVLLQESGRLDEADAMLDLCLPLLAAREELAEFHAEAIAVRGLIALDRGALDAAGADLGRALLLARRLDMVSKLSLRVWAIASLAERRGRLESAAVLRAGARRLARELGVHEPQLRRAEDDGTLDRLRRSLGAGGFTEAERIASRLGVPELLDMAAAVARGDAAP